MQKVFLLNNLVCLVRILGRCYIAQVPLRRDAPVPDSPGAVEEEDGTSIKTKRNEGSPNAFLQKKIFKARCAGLNAISVYVEWCMHEVTKGVSIRGGRR